MAGIYGLVQKIVGSLASRGDDEIRVSCVNNGEMFGTTLDGVTESGAGDEITVSGRRLHSMHIVASDVTVGAVGKLQGSLDGSNWFDMGEQIVDRDGVTMVKCECAVEKVRGYLDFYADGTFSAIIYSTY